MTDISYLDEYPDGYLMSEFDAYGINWQHEEFPASEKEVSIPINGYAVNGCKFFERITDIQFNDETKEVFTFKTNLSGALWIADENSFSVCIWQQIPLAFVRHKSYNSAFELLVPRKFPYIENKDVWCDFDCFYLLSGENQTWMKSGIVMKYNETLFNDIVVDWEATEMLSEINCTTSMLDSLIKCRENNEIMVNQVRTSCRIDGKKRSELEDIHYRNELYINNLLHPLS